MNPDSADGIIGHLEQARSQIEVKFSRAGAVLEAALDLIGRQLESLASLNQALDGQAVDSATRDLTSTSNYLNALPASLSVRDARLRSLANSGNSLCARIGEMRGLLKYLVVFALNVKITAAERAEEASEFEVFAQEMRTRIEQGERELNDFEARLAGLDDQVRAALRLESGLESKAASMLPSVPNRLSGDADAILSYHKSISEVTAGVATLAQQIQLRVVNALSALQIGDITRQRVEHVQAGLAILGEIDQRMAAEGWTKESRSSLRRFTYALLAAQLADTAEAFDREAQVMVEHMAGIAGAAESLLNLQNADGSTDTNGGDLRSLEKSVGDAVALIADMDQAAECADQIQKEASVAVDELVGRVSAIKSVKEDVQYMALNTTVRCARMGDVGKPLQVIAVELRLYAKKLESTTDETLRILQTLAQTSTEREEDDRGQVNVGSKLQDSLERIRAAADAAENNLASVRGQGKDVVQSLTIATEQLNFKAELGDVLNEAADILSAQAGDEATDVTEIVGPLREVLEHMARSYTMARERDVHAAFELPAVDEIEAAA